ncbi:MAG: hypothetical protein QOJ12_1852, partial [Thermoleophilales bacterium]|nr:hypothetical protein [Thermoleophilales bacterium]
MVPRVTAGPDIPRETLAAIANDLVRLKAQYYGKGPTEAK